MKKIILGGFLAVALLQSGLAEIHMLTDFTQAKAQAKTEHKLVMMDFTGSDWCPGCIAFKKEVLDSREFASYAATNVVVLEVDFPEKLEQPADLKKANAALMDKFDVEGYPTLIILNPDGTELTRQVGYDGSGPSAFIAKVEKARTTAK